MAASHRRAVVAGIGLVAPLGCCLDSLWNNLSAGRSGVARLRSIDPNGLPIQIGAELVDFDARKFVEKKDRKRLNQMVRTMHLAAAASQLAMTDAAPGFDPVRFGVVFGSSTIPGDLGELGEAALVSAREDPPGVDLARWGEFGIPKVPPTWLLTHIPNMTASHVSIIHDAQGPNNTISQSDAGGLLALGEALRMVQRDRADGVVVGGADTRVADINLARFTLSGRLSRRNDDPRRACRPFDLDRDGEVLGEGAAAFVLEDRERALTRGAKIYAEVLGFSSGFDGDRSGRELARVIREALADASVAAEDIDHVNAHAGGSQIGDAWEAAAIAEVFGKCRPEIPTTAFKSYFGNLGAGGGLIELAASIAASRHGVVLPTLNYERADPACPIAALRHPRPSRTPFVVKISLTDLGQCAAVVLRFGEGNGP